MTLREAAAALVTALRTRRLVCPACRRDIAEGCSVTCEVRALERALEEDAS